MRKLKSFLKFHSKQNNFLVQIEKIKYPFTRLFGNIYSMGNNLKKGVIMETPYGLFYCRKKCDDLHIISPHYEFEIMEIFKNLLTKSQIIFDVGAHIGKYSIMSSKLNPTAKIYAFEPNKDRFKILQKNKLMNKANNLKIINKALSNDSRKNETLDNFLKSNRIENIDLMKIDIDGGELEFMEGSKRTLSKGKIRNIFMEMNDEIPTVMGLFTNFGYKIKKIRHNNFLISK